MKNVLGASSWSGRAGLPLLIIGVVLGLGLVSGCGKPAQEPPASWPDDESQPSPGPSESDAGSIPTFPAGDGGVPSDGGFPPDAGVISNTPPESQWVSAEVMVAARHDHTASVLPSGKVLVVGRYTGDAIDTAELYDPAARAWNKVGEMASARRGHTASVLPSGKVLVTGGYNTIDGIIASAEVFDPAAPTNPWSSAGRMAAIRTAHTATLLVSGKVLVVGGFGVGGALASAELHDPVSGMWSPTGSMATGRYGHTATLLPSGKVLVVGGQGASGELASAELFDPTSGTWTSAGSMAAARAYHTATLLLSGQVLVAGGNTSDVELYEPSSGIWSRTGFMAAARIHHTATLLPSGKVLVAGGMTTISLASTEAYDPSTRTWSPAGTLAMARSHHAACLLPSGQVLVMGGFAGSGPLRSAELYKP